MALTDWGASTRSGAGLDAAGSRRIRVLLADGLNLADESSFFLYTINNLTQ